MKSDCCGLEKVLVPYDHGQDCRYVCPCEAPACYRVPKLTPAQVKAIRWPCSYCQDAAVGLREPAEYRDGGWWHHIARGGDYGGYEPCQAGQLRNALKDLIPDE